MPQIIHIPKQFCKPMPLDPRDPVVFDQYPTPTEREQAKAAMLCQRADLLDKVPEEAQQKVLKIMDHPSYLELQSDESRLVETIADDAATLLYARTLDQCSREVQCLLRLNAAIFLRATSQAWLSYAREQAIEAVHQQLLEDLGKALPPPAVNGLRGLAARCASVGLARFKDVLGSRTGITPGAYLRVTGKALAERAQHCAEPRR